MMLSSIRTGVRLRLRGEILLSNKRFASDFGAMQEAFLQDLNKPSSSSRSTTTSTSTAKQNAKTSSATHPDPAINISNNYTDNIKPTNANKGSIAQFFGKSLNDFSPSNVNDNTLNWSATFHGLGNAAFSKEAQEVLYSPIPDNDIEITPDGLLYLPEIKYRRILNRAFGAGAWGLAPRSETLISKSGLGGLLTREYGLVIHGRLVSIARGEQTFFSDKGIPTATEGCKSNALMRCCKDLGIASELWDPRFIKQFKKKNCEDIFVEYIPNKKKKKIWKRKDEDVEYPFKR
ncbi:unnamed protein product [Ambrosiozyma monospora]|uniref:Unnamed protein product n=1 Tax=Ambrosiozyma monospora TaxID=43982 RepID=A0ACB5T119_AMBMO|nr:unnamed protein product [Ambrosiozyma monospora]